MSDRHSRQERFGPIGVAGQARLRLARVLVVGVGALGSAVAEMLCRAGVGHLRLVDRDIVEESNLQRQALYTHDDAHHGRAKAHAAAAHLNTIDPQCICEPIAGELTAATVAGLLSGSDLAIDGLDNFPARHLLNEACCRAGVPWIHGAVLGAYGVSMPILPGETACLRCLQSELPAPADNPTCDTAGVISPIVRTVAAWQSVEALKLLVGDRAAVRRELWATDLWTNRFQRIRPQRDPSCRACGPAADWPQLAAGDEPAIVLCGRQAIQIRRTPPGDLRRLATRLGSLVTASNPVFVRFRDGDATATCFADGRVLVQGIADPARARGLCDRWLG
ncbi:MAG: ThiF family adenylyltransferase [Planctomycetota bacterium]